MMDFAREYPVTSTLIALNVIVFVVLEVLGLLQGYGLYNAGVLTPAALAQGRYYTLVTSMFEHGGILHLACNMVTLYYVGCIIEGVFGRVRFLVIYFAAGLAGGFASMAMLTAAGHLNSGVVGASGALFGLFGTYAYLLVREHTSPVVLLQAPTLDDIKGVAGLLVANILIGLMPGIAMEAHLGGLVAGLVVGGVLYEMLRHAIKRKIDAGIEPPSVIPPKPQAYDFEAAQAAQDAAMARQQTFQQQYDQAKPAQREQFEKDASEGFWHQGKADE